MKRSVITLKKPSRKTVVDAAIPFLLLLLSFLFSSIWILLMGKNPLAAYMALLDGAFGSPAALMNTIKKSGINPVVCINRSYTDTDAEIALLKKL